MKTGESLQIPSPDATDAAPEYPWGGLRVTLVFSFLINLLALVTPLYAMIIHDRVIGGQSLIPLYLLSPVVGLALLLLLHLRWQRASYMLWSGREFARQLAEWCWEKLFALPLATLSRQSANSQMNRIKAIERQCDLVVGPLAVALSDLPFVIPGLGVIAWLGGRIVLAPLAGLLFMILIGWVFARFLRGAISDASTAGNRKSAVLRNAWNSLASLRMAGALPGWEKRLRDSAVSSAKALRSQAIRDGLLRAAAVGCMGFTVLLTLVFGVDLALHHAITSGGLLATVLIVWVIFSAPQRVMVSWSRLGQLMLARRQMEALARTPAEAFDPDSVPPNGTFPPSIEFSRVSLRFDTDTGAVLSGVSFKMEPGEILVVQGATGAGKSTLLKAVTGLYKPVGGSLLIADSDIRQFAPRDLRNAISYLPEQSVRGGGSVRDLFRLASPLATDEEMLNLLRTFSGEEFEHYFPQGLGTLVTEDPFHVLTPVVNCLAIARAFHRPAEILLLDNPMLGDISKPGLLKMLADRKGRQTILLVTSDEDLTVLADRTIVLDAGSLVSADSSSPIKPTA